MVEDLINPRHLSHWGSRSETASRPRPNPAPSPSPSPVPVPVPFPAISLLLSLSSVVAFVTGYVTSWRPARCMPHRSQSWTRRRSRNCWNRCQIVENFLLLSFLFFRGFYLIFYVCFACCAALVFCFLLLWFIDCAVSSFCEIVRLAPDEGTPLSTWMHLYFRFIDL